MTAAASQPQVYVIDDRGDFHERLTAEIEQAGYAVFTFPEAEAALQALADHPPAVVLSELRSPRIDGLAVLARCRAAVSDVPVVLMASRDEVAAAAQAVNDGAYDFIEKPVERGRVLAVLTHAVEQQRLRAENRHLRARLSATAGLGEVLVGNSPPIRELGDAVLQLAPTAVDVLIQGEAGTGRQLIARVIHDLSACSGHFIAVNCATMPATQLDAELFGRDGGRVRAAKLELAGGGTLFLQAVDALPPPAQAKLLRVLQQRDESRVSAGQSRPADFRLLASTDQPLQALVYRGQLRADLCNRLNAAVVAVPPLRDRRNDVPLLFAHFLKTAAARFQMPPQPLTSELQERLLAHDWPGNVSELKSAAERVALGFPLAMDGAGRLGETGKSLEQQMATVERMLLEDALRRHRGAVPAVCEELRVTMATCYRRLKVHELDPGNYRS